MNKRLEKQLTRYRAKVEEFNKELQEYITTTGDNELPDVDSTVLSFYALDPFKITEIPDGFSVDAEGYEIEVKVATDEDGEEYITGWDCGCFSPEDTLKAVIAYERRRLKKAWRIWKSDNPDAELERDEE